MAQTKNLLPNGSGTNKTVTMPAGTENVNIEILNTDFSNITDAVNNNYEAIGNVSKLSSKGTFTTLAGLSTILDNALADMATATLITFRVECTTTVLPFYLNINYSVVLYRPGSVTYGHAIFYANARQDIVTAYRNTEGWHYERCADMSHLSNIRLRDVVDIRKDVPGNGGTLQFTITEYGKARITVAGYSSTACGELVFVRVSGENKVTKWLGDAPTLVDISMNSSGTVTITNNATSTIHMAVELMVGTLSNIV